MRRDYSDPGDTARRNDWQTIKTLFPYLWPAREAGLRWRVVWAVIFLAAAKGASVAVPLIYKYAVDALDSKAGAMIAVPGMLPFQAQPVTRALELAFTAALDGAKGARRRAQTCAGIALIVFGSTLIGST